MKRNFYSIVFLFLLQLVVHRVSLGQHLTTNAVAQVGTSELIFPDLESQLISLDSIVQVARKHSPYLKYDSAMIDAKELDIVLAKRRWHNNISAFGNFATGNQTFSVTGGSTENQRNLLNGYRYGINVSIPLGDITTYRTRVQQEKMETEALEFEKAQTEMALERQVIKEYNDLIATQKLLKIKSSNLENFRVLQQLAEKQFREGTSSLEDYANVSDMTVNAEVDFELAKSNFKTQYQHFENLLGVQLTTLMKRK